jgi:hypothetical protein
MWSYLWQVGGVVAGVVLTLHIAILTFSKARDLYESRPHEQLRKKARESHLQVTSRTRQSPSLPLIDLAPRACPLGASFERTAQYF